MDIKNRIQLYGRKVIIDEFIFKEVLHPSWAIGPINWVDRLAQNISMHLSQQAGSPGRI